MTPFASVSAIQSVFLPSFRPFYRESENDRATDHFVMFPNPNQRTTAAAADSLGQLFPSIERDNLRLRFASRRVDLTFCPCVVAPKWANFGSASAHFRKRSLPNSCFFVFKMSGFWNDVAIINLHKGEERAPQRTTEGKWPNIRVFRSTSCPKLNELMGHRHRGIKMKHVLHAGKPFKGRRRHASWSFFPALNRSHNRAHDH